MIDYLRAGRPALDCPEVFGGHRPIGRFSDEDHLHQILVKHARVATSGSTRSPPRHALAQAPLATRLIEEGTPLEHIADILGHQSVRSTGVFLKSSLDLLSSCALDPDAPAQGVSR